MKRLAKSGLSMLLLTGAVALCSPAMALDKATANGLAAAAAKMASDGKTDKARELAFKALAHDEDCGEALYELGKIFEMEKRDVTAADFLSRAAQHLAQGEATSPALATKRLDAERRLRGLNPYAGKYLSLMEEYSKDLVAITKKQPDSMTLEEANDRVNTLRLKTILPPDKQPKIDKPIVRAPAKKTVSGDPDDDDMDPRMIRRPSRTVATNVPPDVETALKKDGWARITGEWKKKADNVYEVTGGKLEADKINGGVQLILHKGSTGTVKIMVRNSQREYEGFSSFVSYGTGFGFGIESASARIYTPYASGLGNRLYSYLERSDSLNDAMPKNKFVVTVMEGKLEYTINEKVVKRTNNPIAKEGPFIIHIEGTATIEMPKAAGQ